MNLETNQLINSLKSSITNNPLESSAPVYQPIYFEEFRDIKASVNKEEFLKKAASILKYLDKDLTNKKILDIGSNAGYFSFAASARNACVDAYEPFTKYTDLCGDLCKIYNIQNINFINDQLTLDSLSGKKYDCAFMLSVFQWISQGSKNLSYAKKLLFKISKHVDTLFFELGCNYGKSSINTNHINHMAVVYNLLKRNTGYEHIKLIGASALWKRAFSKRYLFICTNKDLTVKEAPFSFMKFILI